jgi:hypothetical protein
VCPCIVIERVVVLDVTPAYERAEPEAVIADGNIAEPGQPPQIDQQARGRQAEGENRRQACPLAMTNASGFDASRSIASRRVPGAW